MYTHISQTDKDIQARKLALCSYCFMLLLLLAIINVQNISLHTC